MTYQILTKGHAPEVNGEYHQFQRLVGKFESLEDAKRGARYLSNSRQLPLSLYKIVTTDGDVVVETIEPGEAAYIYGAHMG